MHSLVLFDLDGTLIDRDAAFRAWAEEFVIVHGLDEAALTFLLTADAAHTGPMGSFFATVCDRFDLATPPDQVWAQYRRRMPELVSCRPDDADALRRLRQAGWRIGVVTNGMADNQLGKIRNTGLDRLVDAWCISAEVGVRKPDPEIFRLVAQRCGSGPDCRGWMVGDSLAADVAGGHGAGLRTIWLRPNHRPGRRLDSSSAGPAPDLTVGSVAEAVAVLLGSPG